VALRILLLSVWLLLPGAGLAYHFLGPGEERVKIDTAADLIRAAEKAAAAEDYALAIEKYDEALKLLPAERKAEIRKIRLEKAKAQMLAQALPDAHAELKTLVDELAADSTVDAALLAEAHSTLANSQYYVTWLMRLEGLAREEWEPEIEASRQAYKLLAEDADARGDSAAAQKHREDLESSIRMARMDLSELQGLALPKQCKGCCSCKGKRPGKVIKKGPPNRGASPAPPLDDTGH